MLLILALKDRGESQALSAVVQQLGSESEEVHLAAIDAMGTLDDVSSVPILLSVTDAENTDAVLESLVALQDSSVNTALMQAGQPANASPVAVKALGQRRANEAH